MDEVQGFYDAFAAHYHLLFDDWDGAVRRQGALLDELIADIVGAGPKQIRDVACGIGTQAIGLALHGHDVTATDLSPATAARARREAARFGAVVDLGVADLRHLQDTGRGGFDVVCALDNALPHLHGAAEMGAALHALAGLLLPGGLLLASTRDYAALLVERPRLFQPRLIEDRHGQRIVFQVWDWDDDGASYAIHLYIVRLAAPDTPRSLVFNGRYWPVTRDRLSELAGAAGFEDCRWLEPDSTGFYQPILAARRRRYPAVNP